LRNSVQNGTNLCKRSFHEVASEFFATNAPDPPHWTLNCCFGAFRTIWVHSGPFGCLTKLGAKRDELVQKFVPRSRVGIFRNERTRSTPLDSKLMFWCVSYYLGAFGIVWLPFQNSDQNGPNWCKSSFHEVASEFFTANAPDRPHWTLNSCFGVFRTIWVHLGPFGCLTKLGAKLVELEQKFVPRSCIGIVRNECTRSTHWALNSCFGEFHIVLVHLGPLGCLTKLGAKRAELVQKFVPRSRMGIFRNERTRSTPLDPKLMFWCVSYYLGSFGTIWLPYETRCKTGRTSAKVRASKSRRNFSQRTHPIHPIRPKTDVLVRFILFGCIRDHLVTF